MLETFVIIFREGLEAFLVIAIVIAYLNNTKRHHLKAYVYLGIVTALAISALAGWKVAELVQSPLWEGTLAIFGGALVASFTIHLMLNSSKARHSIGQHIDKAADRQQSLAKLSIFLFTTLMIAREGMETAFMLGTISAQQNSLQMWAGAGLGLFFVGVVGLLWIAQSRRINLKAFLQVTGIFLILFSLYLFVYGLHEISEMNAIPLIGENANTEFHIFTEIIETPLVANLISAGLIGVPVIWLILSLIPQKHAFKTSTPRSAH